MAKPEQALPIDDDEAPVELQIDRIETTLKKLATTLDSEVSTGKDARDLHDFVQDDLLPVLSLLAADVRSLASIVSAHDEMIADLQDEDTDGTRISEEHASELIEHIGECGSLLQQLYDQSKLAGAPLTALVKRIEKGKALIEFIKAATISADDEDDESEPN